jgi:hypothetical protein
MRSLVLPLARRAAFARCACTALEPALEVASAAATYAPRGITAEDTAVFVVGMVPFVWATIEFWRRIAVGESFGTGKDAVIIRDTSGPEELGERRRVLGKDAILTARLLFAAVGVALLLVGYAGYQALHPMADLLQPPTLYE